MELPDITIFMLADELDRLCPSQVGDNVGHVGHEHGDEWPSIGWIDNNHGVGNSVFAIHPNDLPKAYTIFADKNDGSLDNGCLKTLLTGSGLRIEWHV